MFRGRYEHSIDAKGRTSVPSRFREVMVAQGDTQLVLTTGLDPCLVAYPMSEWLAFEKRLSALPQFDADVVMLKRIYVSGAVECEVDKVGRVLIPAALRNHAGFKRDALWAGMVLWLVALLRPATRTRRVALIALTIAALVECSQLYHAAWIDTIRATRPRALVLGQGFLWSDLVSYTVGVTLMAVLDSWFIRHLARPEPSSVA